jgi:hypothetical protein
VHAAQRHARVFGFDDGADAFGVKLVGESICGLFSESLLNLRARREVLDDAGSFDRPSR